MFQCEQCFVWACTECYQDFRTAALVFFPELELNEEATLGATEDADEELIEGDREAVEGSEEVVVGEEVDRVDDAEGEDQGKDVSED